MDALEKDITPVESAPPGAAWVVDAMAVLQSINSAPRTFAELAELVFSITTQAYRSGTTRVDFVTDQYPRVSIKNVERNRRWKSGTLLWKITHPSQKCPTQWKQFLSVGDNKAAFVHFLVQEWSENVEVYGPKLSGRHLVVTCGNSCFELSGVGGTSIFQVPLHELTSTHEEADTRLLLHAAHIARCGHRTIVIRSPDTDVAVLAIYFAEDINARLLFRTGTKNRARFIDLTALACLHTKPLCRALPGVHALTGCDSTSAFVGRGKKPALSILLDPNNAAGREAMGRLGSSFEVSQDLYDEVERFVCLLYGSSHHTDVNELQDVLLEGCAELTAPTNKRCFEEAHTTC